MLFFKLVFVFIAIQISITKDLTCPPNYEKAPHEKLCYKVFSNPVSWIEAFRMCSAEHSYLQQFQSGLGGEKNSDMSSMIIPDKNIDLVWVGLRRLSNYFQWLGINPQLFRSRKNKWGLYWKDNSGNHEWDGCGAVQINSGQLYSKDCTQYLLPFVCVKPFEDYDPRASTSKKIEVRIAPINTALNKTLPTENIFWVDYSDRFHIALECQVVINDVQIHVEDPNSRITISWSKNGIHKSRPINSLLNPNLNTTSPWGDKNTTKIDNFLGTYICEANIPFQSHRHHSNEISLLLKGTQVYKYTISFWFVDKVSIDSLEPTSSNSFSTWNKMITNISTHILPIRKPHVIGATKIEWTLNYIKPQYYVRPNETNYVSISLFVTIETRSTNDDEVKEKLDSIARKFKEFTVRIEPIGKCGPQSEAGRTWAMKLGQSRGLSYPFCVSDKPKYKMIRRRCLVSYEGGNKWDDFEHTQCTSNVTHLLEDYFCPEGHKIENDNFCVALGSKNSTWVEARDECLNRNSHLPYNVRDIYATDEIPTSWSSTRLNERRVYPVPPQEFSGQNWTECVMLNRTNNPIWQTTDCSENRSFICLSRVQETLWKVPWCPGGWLGSEIPVLRNSCFFVNFSLILPEKLKEEHCAKKDATVANTSDLLVYVLVVATVSEQEILNRKHIRTDQLLNMEYLVCEKPKSSKPPRKAKLKLISTELQLKGKYATIKLSCHGTNIRKNSRVDWYRNGDPYLNLSKTESDEKNYLSVVTIELNENEQGDYWCQAWDNYAQTSISSNKIPLTVPGINNYVMVLNSSIFDGIDVKKISDLNKPDSNIVVRDVTLINDQIIIWMTSRSTRSQDDLISVIRTQFKAYLHNLQLDALIPFPLTIRSSEWCLQETTENGRSLTWPQTKRNEATLPKELCLMDDGKPVSRQCVGDFHQGARWGPVRGSCTDEPNEFTKSLYKLSQSNTSFLSCNLLDDLTEATSVKDYKSIDVSYIAEIMQKVSTAGNVTKETLKTFTGIVDRIMNVDSDKMFISHEAVTSSNRYEYRSPLDQLITEALENMISLVPLKPGQSLTFSLPNIYMEVHVLGPDSDDVVGFASNQQTQTTLASASQLNSTFTDDALILPLSLIKERKKQSGNEGLKIYFIVYRNSNYFKEKGTTVNSKVIAASFLNQTVHDYDEPIILMFKPTKKMSLESASCVYWDPKSNGGEWSTAGCWLSSLNSDQGDHVICECNHMSYFAVLTDINLEGAPIDAKHKHILGIITYVGTTLSIIGLSLVILTFLLFRKWRKKDSNKIICNLAVSLLSLLIIFLAGIEQTENPAICQAVVILLHYFILASFCWMLVEAIHQYLMFVRVFGTYVQRFILKAMLFGWGLPLLIVVIIIGIDLKQYEGSKQHCWLKSDAFYYAFLLPIGIIMIINAVVFILVLRGIFCSRQLNLRSNQSKTQLIKTQIFAAICIFILLGLTWIFGFLAIEDARETFQYIFCICNSLQGFLIFIFMVVRDRNAHDLWSSFCGVKKPKTQGSVQFSNSTHQSRPKETHRKTSEV